MSFLVWNVPQKEHICPKRLKCPNFWTSAFFFSICRKKGHVPSYGNSKYRYHNYFYFSPFALIRMNAIMVRTQHTLPGWLLLPPDVKSWRDIQNVSFLSHPPIVIVMFYFYSFAEPTTNLSILHLPIGSFIIPALWIFEKNIILQNRCFAGIG